MTKGEGKKSEKKAEVAGATEGAEVKKSEKGEAKKAPRAKTPVVVAEPRLKKIYREQILPELFKEFGYTSKMQTPRLEKIVVNMGVGEALQNKKLLDAAVDDLTLITGQKAVKTKARKSIANFKIRAGQEIGVKVTLRGARMYEFLDRLVNVALPRVKDFRGVNQNAFDGHGNYSLGIIEQIIFPEIDFDKIERVSGLNIVIVTTARTDAEAKAFLTKFGMPFRK
jgi:large subunit ribosomal protein L5